MDVLSSALGGMRLQSSMFGWLDAAGDFALDCGDYGTITLYCVVTGGCYIDMSGREAIRMDAGDVLLMPRWRQHVLCSSPSVKPRPLEEAIRDSGREVWDPKGFLGQYVRLTLGDTTSANPKVQMLTILFRAPDAHRSALIDCLPPIVHSRAETTGIDSLLRVVQSFIAIELSSKHPGFAASAHRLAELLFIQIIRTVVDHQPVGTTGWLRGLSSPKIAHALSSMHREPGKRWSIETLAHSIAMSRSAFAAKFVDVVGIPPMSYLRELRVRYAEERLTEGASMKQVASEMGYRSSYGFSRASRKTRGKSAKV